MTKRAFIFAAPVLVFLISLAHGQTADELIKKYTDARGGIAKIKAIKSLKATGKIVQGGLEIPITVQQKRPSSLRVEVTFQGKSQIQAYDGAAGWKIDPFQGSSEPEAMTADDLKQAQEQADIDGPLVDYKEKGHTVELQGKEDVEGTPAYKIKVTLKGGDVRYIWLDAGNYLEIKLSAKRKTPGGEIEIDSFPGNYKQVAGTAMPFSVEHKVGGQTIYSLTRDKVETDVAMYDSLFKLPTQTADKPKKD